MLRRFTRTESDPFYQYEKLLSAYSIAYWSEEYFNNRALFSDYYLKERVRECDEWKEDPKPVYRVLEGLYREASKRFAGKKKGELQEGLLQPVFDALGFFHTALKKGEDNPLNPDYFLYAPSDHTEPIAVCLSYPWGRSLDSKDESRDSEAPEDNPGASVVSLLEKGNAPWAIVTNGKVWRLYAQRTHSKATNYYEIDLDELLSQHGVSAGDPAEAFRYFWLLFRMEAFVPVEKIILGKEKRASFLDLLLLESEEYAKELGERLKERVFEKVFPHLAEGFIFYLQEKKAFNDDISDEHLHDIFQGTLTLLYRILFLLYAESRDLLPVKETRGYHELSLSKLKREIADIAGTIYEETPARLKAHYRKGCYELYERLNNLFRFIDMGDPSINLPMYNGGLFLSNTDENDISPEAKNALFLNKTRLGDRYISLALDLLTRDLDPKRPDLVFIDYKSLGVRHLGYPENPEAVRFCNEELGGVRIRRMDSDADPKERSRLVQGFAPKANNRPDLKGTEKEIDILISTDVLSEGQNLQDCGSLINYDLHWNPTRMVQRAGRIDRLGSDFDTLWIYNMFPDEGLERLLGLVESLSRKIASIDQLGMLDASVLGETVHPQNFNNLRRIHDEDGSVIEEEEEFLDLASNEFMQQQLKEILAAGGKEMFESLPDGIHSGLVRKDFTGIFFYFRANPQGKNNIVHFWKYYDVKRKRIIDNKYEIASLIRCSKDTPRVVDPDMFRMVFETQERVIDDILKSYQQKKALAATPKTVDPIQQTVSTALQKYLNYPDIERRRIVQTMHFLNQPMLSVQIKELRRIYKEF